MNKIKNFLIIAILVTLTSCGFEPLYKHNHATLGKVSISKDIFVDVILDREGQILRDLLVRKISRAPEGAKYTLKTNLKVNTTDLGINIDDVATRKVLWVRADFQLLEGEKIVYSGVSANNVSYAVNNNEFVTLNVRKDEIEKSLQLMADDIKIKIASFLR